MLFLAISVFYINALNNVQASVLMFDKSIVQFNST